MNLLLKRFDKNYTYQYGIMSVINEEFRKWFVLENGFAQKYIPPGTYEIDFIKEPTPKTLKYRELFDWFTYHLEIKNVPNSSYVYQHIGNDERDTDMCQLICNTCDLTPSTKHGFMGESTQAFKEYYLEVSKRLNSNEKVYITILE